MRLKTATVHAAFCVCLPTPPGSSLNCCPPRGRPARRAEPGKAEASAGPPSGACVNEGAEDAGGGGASEAGRAGRLGGGGGEGPPTSAARSPPLGPTVASQPPLRGSPQAGPECRNNSPATGVIQKHPASDRRGRTLATVETCIVERWWKVPLSKEGRQPRVKHRRFRVFCLVEDTKHSPKKPLELILTQTVDDVGSRGDIVLVHRSFGRNELLFKNRAVYASPENKQIFEEENQLRREGKLPKLQTHTGEKTVRFLRKCTLEIGVNDCDEWQLTDAIVARHFLRNLGVVVPPHTLKLPDEPITELGEYWCEVTSQYNLGNGRVKLLSKKGRLEEGVAQ
ncbi:large ribosomal subunit protein bL9m isoform X2 [Rhineura floridana]|uniref:large ribosomal subunit protein bL9m isoform X2 n=1 Tax=Rhineura floridana TaxID=261503 RepID=UPI002AC828B6|nr:large ribosomal subunit protein bL9m isoform X2 [Rhineura floridana]